MDNTEKVKVTIIIGTEVAGFLVNTGRALQAIELCKECLFLLLNNTPRFEEDQLKKIYCVIYLVMFGAYTVISDYTNAARLGREVIAMVYDSGDTNMEANLSLALAGIYRIQKRFVEEKELYERAIEIMKANGDREGEAAAYQHLGAVVSFFLSTATCPCLIVLHTVPDTVMLTYFYFPVDMISVHDSRDQIRGEVSG